MRANFNLVIQTIDYQTLIINIFTNVFFNFYYFRFVMIILVEDLGGNATHEFVY